MKKYFILVLTMSMMLACKQNDVNGIIFDSLDDPKGTLISTVSADGHAGNYLTFTPEATTQIYCDDHNRIKCASGEMAIVGHLAGLAAITSLPTDIQWQNAVSVVPGYGYIQRVKASAFSSEMYSKYVDSEGYLYCRLYCIYSMGTVGSNGGRITNVFKHQSPFVPNNVKLSNMNN